MTRLVLALAFLLSACTIGVIENPDVPSDTLALYCASSTPIYPPKDTTRIDCGVRQIQNSDDVKRFCKVSGTRVERDSAYAKALDERNRQWQRLCIPD